jgi:hypothetical protein
MSDDTLTVDRDLLEKAVLALTQVRDGIACGLLQSFDDEEQACPEIGQQLWYISVLVRTSLIAALEPPHPAPFPFPVTLGEA